MLRSAKFLLLLLAGGAVLAALLGFAEIRRAVDEALAESRSRLESADVIRYEKKVLTPISSPYLSLIQAARRTRDMAAFRDGYAAATDGGLVLLGKDGEQKKHFSVLDGLPDSDLTSLAIFGDLLFVGTRTAGLISFDGTKFKSYRLLADNVSAVTSLLSNDKRLLIGTFGGGVIEFDGREFRKVSLGKDGLNVSTLQAIGQDLYVGTFNDGLFISDHGSARRLTTAEGLPSNRVTAITEREDQIYVATDLGFGVIESGAFRQLVIVPALSGLAVHDNRLLLARENGELLYFGMELEIVADKTAAENSTLRQIAQTLWHLSSEGIYQVEHGRRKLFGPDSKEELTDNFISAVAFGPADETWIGTFRNGIDVLGPDGRKHRHIESDELRQVNYLGGEDEQITAATASGMFTFGETREPVKSASSGTLPFGSVMHFTDRAVSTSSGLALKDGNRFRIISAVQGLPSNSVYTSLESGGRLYVGTMNGLAEIDGSRVTRTFNDTNSGLTTNWVTALCKAGERIFIGTYGGGIFELMPSGEFRSFEPETGKFAVNINAIFTDGHRLYSGTLDGIRILDLRSQKWSRLVHGLPARTVMAINGNGDAIYFGTTNGILRIEKAYFKQTEE